jgi:hypothetical protein
MIVTAIFVFFFLILPSFMEIFRELNSTVGIATGFGLDDRISISGRNKILFFTPQRLYRLWDPHSLLASRYRGLLLQE